MTNDKNSYQPDDGFNVTIENLEKDFMNATTPYDKWKVFQRSLNWIKTKDELEHYLKEKLKEMNENE